jgi:hypothetical protein
MKIRGTNIIRQFRVSVLACKFGISLDDARLLKAGKPVDVDAELVQDMIQNDLVVPESIAQPVKVKRESTARLRKNNNYIKE